MSQYKHYSFDLWLTLIKSNPEFKQKRAEYFHKHFNRNRLTVDKISAIIREVDIMCNCSNEVVGKNIDAFEMYTMVLYKLGYDFAKLSFRDIQSLYHTIETMFFEYRPVMYSTDTVPALIKLKQDATLSILSNTGFIKGHTLVRLLNELGIDHLFTFKLFSDQMGISKPNNQVYLTLINAVNQYRAHNPVLQNEILHIGDNEKADYIGAQQSGINSLLINSNDKTIKDVL